MDTINVHLGELTLKGRNRKLFESRLLDNIRAVAPDTKIKNLRGRILLYPKKPDAVLESLKKVFGISWFAKSLVLQKNLRKIAEGISKSTGDEKIKLETKRTDKKFPKTSLEISREIAGLLDRMGKKTAVKDYEKMVIVEILEDKAIVNFGKIKGLGGLPYGSSGKLLAFLSGGIDSPVAAWFMMKRGCDMEFFHVHPFSNREVKKSKMVKLVRKLAEYSPKPLKLHLTPYEEFYKQIYWIPESYRMIVFRRFMFSLGNKIAEKNSALGVVTGDSVGQVASQTLQNMIAVGAASELPVYRPLVGMDKDDIISTAKNIGTYDTSIEKYEDCCALVAKKHPETRSDPEKIKKIEDVMKLDEIIEKSFEKTETVSIRNQSS